VRLIVGWSLHFVDFVFDLYIFRKKRLWRVRVFRAMMFCVCVGDCFLSFWRITEPSSSKVKQCKRLNPSRSLEMTVTTPNYTASRSPLWDLEYGNRIK
jgi:hypothetical protein